MMLKKITSNRKIFRNALVGLICYSLLGCTLGPNFCPVPLKAPGRWHGATSTIATTQSNRAVTSSWWKSFRDPILNQLVGRALAHNLDLQAARARILAARSITAYDFATLFPKLEGDAFTSRLSPGFITFNKEFGLTQGTVDARWELDIFGGNRRALEADRHLLNAKVAEHNDLQLSLIAEIASNYIDVRLNQKLIAISNRNLDNANTTWALTRSLQKGGISNELDVIQAKTQVDRFRSEIPVYKINLAVAKNRLTTLLGILPGELDTVLATNHPHLPKFQEKILLSTPINVIRHRPDIRQKEHELAAKTALIGNAIAKLFPSISLGAFYGGQGTTIYPHTAIWGLAPNIYVPLLDFGRIQAQINSARANEREAFFIYKSTVLKALEEVENRITAYIYTKQREQSLIALSNSNELAFSLSKKRYKEGLTSFINVTEAEMSLNDNQINSTRVQAEKLKNLIAIYKALGCS